jgi:hypothetical protein
VKIQAETRVKGVEGDAKKSEGGEKKDKRREVEAQSSA